jgi:DNA-binding transcriptional MocR family regulator
LVSSGAKLLWARLARYAGTRGQCYPLLSTLAVDLGFSERQVQRYLAELISGGFLRARQRGLNQSNLYEFL